MAINTDYIRNLSDASSYADKTSGSFNGITTLRDNEVENDVGGAVFLEVLSIVIKDGRIINLLEVYQNIVVEESIFASSITGFIQIGDIGAILEKFMIRGGETIIIKMSKSKGGEVLVWREDLIVTKISGASFDVVSGTAMYNLHFAPKTYINSLKTCLFKSYKDQSITDAAISIYKEVSVNDLFVEDSKITLANPFISAGFMPHKALEYLAQRACQKKYFVFFERFFPIYGNFSDASPFTATHYFGSIDKLRDESENLKIKTVIFGPKLNSAYEGSAIRASKFSTRENFNHIPAMQLGFYNSKITSINPITKEVSHQKLAYTDSRENANDFYESKLLDDVNIFSIYDDIRNQIPGRKVITAGINDSVGKENWLKNNIYGYLSKNYFKATIEIQGGTNRISAGHVISLFIPSNYQKIIEPKALYPRADVVHSGKYLVTRVVHTISGGVHVKTLELSRASMPYDVNRHTLFDNYIEDVTKEILGDRRT
jgi:hypothetical protein